MIGAKQQSHYTSAEVGGLLIDQLAGTPHAERPTGSDTAVSELVGDGDVADVDGSRTSQQFQSHADRQPGDVADVAR